MSGKWNEETRTIEWSGTTSEGYASAAQVHFVNEDTIVSNFPVKDAAGEVLMNMEFKMTRLKGAQE